MSVSNVLDDLKNIMIAKSYSINNLNHPKDNTFIVENSSGESEFLMNSNRIKGKFKIILYKKIDYLDYFGFEKSVNEEIYLIISTIKNSIGSNSFIEIPEFAWEIIDDGSWKLININLEILYTGGV